MEPNPTTTTGRRATPWIVGGLGAAVVVALVVGMSAWLPRLESIFADADQRPELEASMPVSVGLADNGEAPRRPELQVVVEDLELSMAWQNVTPPGAPAVELPELTEGRTAIVVWWNGGDAGQRLDSVRLDGDDWVIVADGYERNNCASLTMLASTRSVIIVEHEPPVGQVRLEYHRRDCPS